MFKRFVFKLAAVAMLGWMFVALLSAAPALAAPAESGKLTRLPPVGQEIDWEDFQGAPTIPPGTVGLWVWSEDVGGQEVLRIRTGSDGSAHTFTGTIRTARAANFYDIAVVNGDGDDTTVTTAYNEFTFSIATTGAGEGVDANWSGRWLYLDLYVDGVHNPPLIFYGAAGTASTGAPLGVRAGKEGLLAIPLTTLDGPTSFEQNIANGYFIYRDAEGRYHLRVTTTSTDVLVRYRGSIVAEDGTFRGIRVYKNDPRDFVNLHGGKVLKFRFLTKGYVDGIDWLIGGPDNMTITLQMDGQMAAPNISLGAEPFGTVKAYTFRLVE